ncbi:MAG TPA: type II toxin-antitoxin system VapC family toxin [Microvirga sp.]|jgi:predicted nucleic acid-binding protein|nr:type II toxin-antitoxin system VapC family toxin [Microvirga sp.]
MPEEVVRVYFDANVFIYAMETDNDRGLLARRWIAQLDRREILGVTSELTLGEVLPHPIASDDHDPIRAYDRLLKDRTTLRVCPVERSLVIAAAKLRALLKAELPDAIHVATAIEMKCEGFLTEDERLKLPPGIKKLSLIDARYPL